jgi:hypothetical protein
LESLKESGEVMRVSGYMDDLAVTVGEAEAVNRLIPRLEEYCKATGASLNYEKCFVLSTEKYKPEGEFKKMRKENYRSHRVMYRGVPYRRGLNLTRTGRR